MNKTTNRKDLNIILTQTLRALFLFILALMPLTIKAQSSAPTARTPGAPAGSYKLSDFDTVNLFSGNLNVSLPLLNVSGRGDAGQGISLTIERQWDFSERHEAWQEPGQTVAVYADKSPDAYFAGVVEIDASLNVDYQDGCGGGDGGPTIWRHHYAVNLSYTEPDGTQHVLRDSVLHGLPYITCGATTVNLGRVFVSSESFITFVADNDVTLQSGGAATGYLIFRDGTKKRVETDASGMGRIMWSQDRNGNKIEYTNNSGTSTLSKIKDSLNREVNFENYISEPAPYGTSTKITYKGVGGTDKIIRVSWGGGSVLRTTQSYDSSTFKTYAELFAGGDPDADEYLAQAHSAYAPNDAQTPTAVWLPDGRSYQFRYNVYGQLARIELPTGGAIEYDYFSPVLSGFGTPAVNRVKERRVYKESNALINKTVFSFVITSVGTRPATVVSVEQFDAADNRLSKAKHYFYGAAGGGYGHIVPWWNGKEYKTEAYDSNGTTLLRVIEHDWQQRIASWCYNNPYFASPCGTNPAETASNNSPFIIEAKETLADANQVRKTSFVNPTTGDWAFDNFINPTDVWEYDYGNGQPGQFLRRTHTDYVADSNYTSCSSSTSLCLVSLPSQKWVSSDSNGSNKASFAQFEYDNYSSGNYAPLVSRSSVSGHDTTNYGSSYTRRGNVVKVTSYENAQSQTGAVSAYSQYDILGNVVKTIDAKNNATIINYDDNFGSPDGNAQTNSPPIQLNGQNTFAFATSGTNPLNWTGYVQFDYFSGAPVNTEDIIGVISKTLYSDVLDRPTQFFTAVGTASEIQSKIVYDDANHRIETTSDLNSLNDNLIKSESFYDGLGRTTESRSYRDGDYVVVKPEYDALGRVKQVTNPYRPLRSEQPVLTQTKYDALGRIKETETPDGAKVLTAYDGNRVLITDQAGKQRISKTNALGHLTEVWEITAADAATVSVSFPNQTLSAGYQTSYIYDVLNNLKTINQGSQTRSFTYNSLSRLLTAANPESGTIGYHYDANGNLTQKTDARSITTNNTYDALNRVTFRNYSNSTYDVTYTYDDTNVAYAKGKLTKVTSDVSTTEYTSFDRMGRVTGHKQTTDGTAYTTGYLYNLSGALLEETYPSGRVVKNVLDNDGELSVVQSKKNSNYGYFNYADSFTYTAAGAVSSMQLGNGKWESTQFNSRLQPTQIALGTTPQATNLLKLDYSYGTTQNNGNIQTQTITVPTVGQATGFTATQTYTYDSLNRLKIAEETGGAQGWKETYLYDRYGNKNYDPSGSNTTTITGCPTNVCNPTINTTTNKNQLNGYVYDNAGNTTTDAQNRTFTYDGENKQTKVMNGAQTVGEYSYDGDGKRVKKVVGTDVTIFVYDAMGKLVAEYANQTSQTPQMSYLTNDHLGSPRITTDKNGTVFSRRDFLPFGEEIKSTQMSQRNINLNYGEDGVRQKFTGYERDSETDLEYAKARYYNRNYGRFASVDPIMMRKGRMLDPQQINLYVYVRNNPFKFIDINGEELILANAVAQKQARANIDKNLTSAERANITIQGNRVVLVNATAIDTKKASEGYKLLYEYIGPNATLNASYYGIQAGQTVTTPMNGTVTYAEVAATGDVGRQDGNNFEFVVAVGSTVQAADSQTPPQAIDFPEHLIFAHALAHGSCGDVGMCAVHRENLLRQEQGLPLRSATVGHTNFDANGREITIPFLPTPTVTVGTSPSEIITLRPDKIDTNIIPQPLEPMPKKP